tara:strand:+ start:2008 stop:2412 length:405 start_codon:yes stop_codon:yes gene_type:complete
MISNDKQLNMPLIGDSKQIIDLPYDEVARLSTPLQAVRHCVFKIDLTEDDWADYLGIKQGTLNAILNADKHDHRKRNFPLHWINLIQRKAGNRCITQFLDLESKGMLYCQRKIEEELTLEEENKLLKEQLRRLA